MQSLLKALCAVFMASAMICTAQTQNTQVRDVVTTSLFTRELLTNETQLEWQIALGLFPIVDNTSNSLWMSVTSFVYSLPPTPLGYFVQTNRYVPTNDITLTTNANNVVAIGDNIASIATNLINSPTFISSLSNLFVSNTNIQSSFLSIIFNYNQTNSLQYVENGGLMSPTYITGPTNAYWMDYGFQWGGPMYGTLIATNQYTMLIGTTNGYAYKMFSFNVDAVGTNTTLLINTNSVTQFTTNGWTISNNYYTRVLTNGNEFRMTVQTNKAGTSSQWQLFGQ